MNKDLWDIRNKAYVEKLSKESPQVTLISVFLHDLQTALPGHLLQVMQLVGRRLVEGRDAQTAHNVSCLPFQSFEVLITATNVADRGDVLSCHQVVASRVPFRLRSHTGCEGVAAAGESASGSVVAEVYGNAGAASGGENGSGVQAQPQWVPG